MAKPFIIRVRLEKATDETYVKLVKILLSNGYSVKLLSKERTYYILPLGNFFIETTEDRFELLETTKNIVENFWKNKFQILVTETIPKGSAWCGLLES